MYETCLKELSQCTGSTEKKNVSVLPSVFLFVYASLKPPHECDLDIYRHTEIWNIERRTWDLFPASLHVCMV